MFAWLTMAREHCSQARCPQWFTTDVCHLFPLLKGSVASSSYACMAGRCTVDVYHWVSEVVCLCLKDSKTHGVLCFLGLVEHYNGVLHVLWWQICRYMEVHTCFERETANWFKWSNETLQLLSMCLYFIVHYKSKNITPVGQEFSTLLHPVPPCCCSWSIQHVCLIQCPCVESFCMQLSFWLFFWSFLCRSFLVAGFFVWEETFLAISCAPLKSHPSPHFPLNQGKLTVMIWLKICHWCWDKLFGWCYYRYSYQKLSSFFTEAMLLLIPNENYFEIKTEVYRWYECLLFCSKSLFI